MSHEERISPNSLPSLVAEHESRYRFARPAVTAAGTWCDLSCGTAAGSSLALLDVLPAHVVLTDIDEFALAEATENLGGGTRITARQLDLTSTSELGSLGELLESLPSPLVVTCFEVIEHLPTFGPLISFLRDVGRAGATVVLSAPNDVFSGVQNPFHVTAWGASTVSELVQLLPEDRIIATQISLEGTAIIAEYEGTIPASAPRPIVELPPPLAYLVAFGPLIAHLGPVAVTAVSDSLTRRVWEAHRESDANYFRWAAAEVDVLRARIVELETELTRARTGG